MKTEILYGIHPTAETLRADRRRAVELFVDRAAPAGRTGAVVDLASHRNLPVHAVDSAKLKSLCGSGDHQGVAIRVGPYPVEDLSALLAHRGGSGSAPAPFLVLLDSIVDPHNLGAIVRTALCAGADGVVTPKDRCAPPSPAVSKISAGALEHIRLARVTNLVRAIRELKNAGLWVLGLDREADAAVYGCDLTLPTALVIGGEEKGIRRLVRDECDRLIAIPQKRGIDSLNASVAGAVAMYEVLRQRLAAG